MDLVYKEDISDIRNYDWIPSVTWLLSLIVDEQFDMLNRNPDFERILKAAWERWTAVHKYIEDDLAWKNPIAQEEYKWFIKQYIIYKARYWVKQWLSEKFLKWKYCAGTIDYIERTNLISSTLIDWKTAKNKPTWLLLYKYELQLWAYYSLCEINNEHIKDWKIVIFMEKWLHVIELDEYQLIQKAKEFKKIVDYYNQKAGIEVEYINTHSTSVIEALAEQAWNQLNNIWLHRQAWISSSLQWLAADTAFIDEATTPETITRAAEELNRAIETMSLTHDGDTEIAF